MPRLGRPGRAARRPGWRRSTPRRCGSSPRRGTAAHRADPARPGARRGRRRRVERRPATSSRCCPSTRTRRPQLLRDALRERLGVEVARDHQRHDGPHRGARASPTPRSASPASPRSPTRAGAIDAYGNTLETTRVGDRRRDRRRGRPGQGQAARRAGRDRARPRPRRQAARRRQRAAASCIRDPDAGHVPARHRGGDRASAARTPAGSSEPRAAAARRRGRGRHRDAHDDAGAGGGAAGVPRLPRRPRRTRCGARACRATSPPARWCSTRPAQAVLLTLHPRVGRWVQVGGHCEPGDHTLLDAAAREAREESGIGSLSFDPTPLDLDVHPITCSLGVPDPALRRAVPGDRAGRRRAGAQRRVARPALVPLGRAAGRLRRPSCRRSSPPPAPACGNDATRSRRSTTGRCRTRPRRSSGRPACWRRTARSSAPFPLASVTKPLAALAVLVAVEEEAVVAGRRGRPGLLPGRDAAAPARARVRAARPERREPIQPPGARRIYSNAGFELAAELVERGTDLPFARLPRTRRCARRCSMTSTELPGSPASGGVSSVLDLARVVQELLSSDRAAQRADARRSGHRPVPRTARRAARLRRPGRQRLGAGLRDPRRPSRRTGRAARTRRGRSATSGRAARCSGSTRTPSSGWSR